MSQEDSKIFKRPNVPKPFQKILVRTVHNIKNRANGQRRVPLATFINSGEDDDEIGDETEMSVDTMTSSSCAEYSTYGRCLGYHAPQKMSFNQSVTPSGASSRFNRTVDESILLGNSAWSNQLNNMPQWTVEQWLKHCPPTCNGPANVVYKNAVGSSLPNMINESMKDVSRVSSILVRVSVPKATSSFLQTPSAPKSTHDVISPNGYTSRVRLQTSAEKKTITSNLTPKESQVRELEGWHILRAGNPVQIYLCGTDSRSGTSVQETIVCRRDLRTVVTTSETTYKLIGSLSDNHHSMPDHMKRNFAGGFPIDWSELFNWWRTNRDRSVGSMARNSSTCPQQQEDKRAEKRRAIPFLPPSQTNVSPLLPQDQNGSDDEDSSLTYSAGSSLLLKTSYRPTKAQSARMAPKKNKTAPSTKPVVYGDTDDSAMETSEVRASNSGIKLQDCSVVLSDIRNKKIAHKKTSEEEELDDEIFLSNWRLRVETTNGVKIRITGDVQNGARNHTSPVITKRLNSHTLETDKGIKYYLINKPKWMEPGRGESSLPETVKQKFCEGFPTQWHSIVANACGGQHNSNTSNKKTDIAKEKGTGVTKEKSKSKSVAVEVDDGKDINANVEEPRRGKVKEKKKNIPIQTPGPIEYLIGGEEEVDDPDVEIQHAMTTEPRIGNPSSIYSGVSKRMKGYEGEIERWITNWRVIPHESEKNVFMLEGCLTDRYGVVVEENHISPNITKRLQARVILCDNITYHLVDHPEWPKSEEGESSGLHNLRKKFDKGFQLNWYTLAKAMFNNDGPSILPEGVAGIKYTTSSFGRVILGPLKYFEGEQMRVVNGKTVLVKKNNTFNKVKGNTPDKKVKATPTPEAKSKPSPAAKKRITHEKKTVEPVQAKKARVAESGTSKKTSKSQENSKSCKASKADKPTKSEASTTKKEVKPKKKKKEEEEIDYSELDEDELSEIMRSNPKNKKQKDKKDGCVEYLRKFATHKEKDLFHNCVLSESEEEIGGEKEIWDTESVSSKVTSEDDLSRMHFNYTPPGERMSKLLAKTTPHRHDTSMDFEDNRNNNKRSKEFMARQLKKTKNLTKRQREEQEIAEIKCAKLMKYKDIEAGDTKLVNKIFDNLTSGAVDKRVKDYINTLPPPSQEDEDSDSPKELYFSEDEDSDDGKILL